MTILNAFNMDISLYAKQKLSSMVTLEKTRNRDVKTKTVTGISQQPAAMEKCWRALPFLTADSEQTKVMTHLDLDDTKYHEVSNRQAGRRV